jgi:hypothetical protein
MKDIIGFIAAALAFVAYAPYIRDLLKNKTKPHPYSWFIWGLITAVIFALQISHKAGAGAYVTLTVAVLSFVIAGLSLVRNGRGDIILWDTVCLFVALVAICLWLFAKQPVLSMVLLVSIDLVGFIPTVRKAWSKPYEETLFTWELNGFRHALSVLAIQSYSLITLLNPVVWAGANLIFSLILIIRRKQLKGFR